MELLRITIDSRESRDQLRAEHWVRLRSYSWHQPSTDVRVSAAEPHVSWSSELNSALTIALHVSQQIFLFLVDFCCWHGHRNIPDFCVQKLLDLSVRDAS